MGDRGLEFFDTGVRAALDVAFADQSEQAFGQVYSGRQGRREVQVVAWMFGEPCAHSLGLVGAVVVHEGGFQCHEPTMPSSAHARDGKTLINRGFLEMRQATRSNRTGFSRRTDRSTPSSTKRRPPPLSSPAETVENRRRSTRL